jgi:hypothetical protein
MRKTTVAASAAILMAVSWMATGAEAMTPSASGVRAAMSATGLTESVAVVCGRRCPGCRRVCWQQGPYYGGYYPGYYGYPGYGYPGYYGPGIGVYGPGIGIGIGVGPRWGW